MSESTVAGTPARVQLTVSGILEDLNQGLTRDGIRSKYNLSAKDIKDLFSHPKLKGKKTKPAPSFVLTDDTPDEVVAETPSTDAPEENTQAPEVVAETPSEEPATDAVPAWEEPQDEVKVSDDF